MKQFFSQYKYHLGLHGIVLLFGLTGIFAKLIDVPSEVLVWYRVFIGVSAIGIYFKFKKINFKLSKKWLLKNLGVGIIVAIHWITFFEAIKQSNVSVALVCFSSGTLFTAIIEPFYFKRKLRLYELFLGLLIIAGLLIIFSVELRYINGILLSVFSAFLASWFTVLNGKYVQKVRANVLSFYQLLSALLIVSIYILIKKVSIENFYLHGLDILWILILGIVCTAFAFIASVYVMRKLSPYTVTITVNLEPVYSIILAVLIWPESEKMDIKFYIGASVVLLAIFLNAVLKKKLNH